MSKAAQRLFSVALYDEALYAHQHALLTSLVVDDHDLDQASILCNNIACSLVACKQYSQAMAYFNHSLSSTPSQKNPMTLMNIGILHVLQHEFNNALDYFYQAKLQVCTISTKLFTDYFLQLASSLTYKMYVFKICSWVMMKCHKFQSKANLKI